MHRESGVRLGERLSHRLMGFQANRVRMQDLLKVFNLLSCKLINADLISAFEETLPAFIERLHQELLKLGLTDPLCFIHAVSFRSLMHDAELLVILTILRYHRITLLLRISIGPKVTVLDASDVLDRTWIVRWHIIGKELVDLVLVAILVREVAHDLLKISGTF